MYGFVSPADRFASGEDWSLKNDDAGELVYGWNSIGNGVEGLRVDERTV
jgi:hypothetical protein